MPYLRYMYFVSLFNDHIRNTDFEKSLVERFAATAEECIFVGESPLP